MYVCFLNLIKLLISVRQILTSLSLINLVSYLLHLVFVRNWSFDWNLWLTLWKIELSFEKLLNKLLVEFICSLINTFICCITFKFQKRFYTYWILFLVHYHSVVKERIPKETISEIVEFLKKKHKPPYDIK